jgi:hypothetical protein
MEIRRDHGQYFLHDLGSRSGTYLNGVRISVPVPLQDGDLITVGDHQLRFVHDASGTAVLDCEVPSGLDDTGEFSRPGDLRGMEKGLGSILGQDRQSTRSPQALPALTVRPRRTDGGPEPLSLPGRLRRWVAALRALVGRRERPVGRFVDCSLFAPPRITPGRSILVQAFLYLDEDQELMQRLATTFDSEAHPRGFRRLATAVSPGSKFLLVLRLPGLEVAPSEQSITWQGRFEAAQFVVTADKARNAETLSGRS